MKTLDVKHKSGSYNIYIERNILKKAGRYLKENFNGRKIAVIADDNLKRLYGELLENIIMSNGLNAKIISIKPGEESKSLDTLQNIIYKELLDFKMGRSDIIVTFGGGVVGDLGGFAASTYMRGIPYIQIPTSLLAQVDSSIGGKVAVDLPWGKNLVGSFYNPQAVFIDPDLLKTLHKRFLHDGLSEVIKYGFIKDKSIIDKLLNCKDDEDLLNDAEDIIYKCCSIKKSVVEIDEKDFGERMLLNFGHTFGHALEKYFDYKKYTHGEAVGIGMLHITRKSEKIGITEAGTSELIEKVLKKFDLPYEVPAVNMNDIFETIALDKKTFGNSINLILLKKIGESFIKKVESDDLEYYI